MEIAIAVVFLALVIGAFFLLILIAALFIWRRYKRGNGRQTRQFSSTRSQFIENDSIDDDSDNDAFAFADDSGYSTDYSNSTPEDFGAAASMSFESAVEGGSFVSDSSDSSASSYDSSTSYDSSSSDSSGSSDSGSSSSSWD